MKDYQGEAAVLRYEQSYFNVVKPGLFVICAQSGEKIPLADLCYWSVELQEPYASPLAALKAYENTGKNEVNE